MTKKNLFISLIILQVFIVISFATEIIQKQKNISKKAIVNSISKESITLLPTKDLRYFYEPRKNIIIKDDFDWNPSIAKYTINSDSLNERFEYSFSKTKEIFRIVTLGDSFTYGLGVSTGDNWTEILEDKLNNYVKKCKKLSKIEVINLGVHGYDIQYEVERYRIRGIKYDPDMILWMLFDPLRIKEYIAPIINACTGKLPYKTDPLKYIDCWVKSQDLLVKEFGKPKIVNILKEKFLSIFKYFNKNIVVLDFLKNHDQILSNVNGIKILDNFKIAKYLAYGEKNNKYYLYDGHPNQAGHQKIAEDVFEYLTKNKLIPCN